MGQANLIVGTARYQPLIVELEMGALKIFMIHN